MKAISLHQPWASLVLHGHKTIETRAWPPGFTGPLAVHASKWCPGPRLMLDPDTEDAAALDPALLGPLFPQLDLWALHISTRRELFETLPRGAVLATCRLADALRMLATPDGMALVDGRGRVVRSVRESELQFGCYSTGRWGWILGDVVPLPLPEPARGAQGLWEWRREAVVSA